MLFQEVEHKAKMHRRNVDYIMRWSLYNVYSPDYNHNKGKKIPKEHHTIVLETLLKQYSDTEKFIQFIQLISQFDRVKS